MTPPPPDLLLSLFFPCFSSLLPSPILSSPPFPSSFSFHFPYIKLTATINFLKYQLGSVAQSCQLFATSQTAACQASLSITTPGACSNSSPSSQWCHPTISSFVILSSCLKSFPASVFSKESVLHIRCPRCWSFSFSISPCNEDSGLIFFRTDWFDLLAVQGTLKNLLQHHSSETSILQHSIFFIVQLLHPYMTTGKTIALTLWTFVSKEMSLVFNMLSRWL